MSLLDSTQLPLPSSSSSSSSHRNKQSAATSRQSRSCKVCRLRKVKCDRVKPCHACCAHGYPSKCAYEAIPGDDPISQADEISNLRTEIHQLKCRLDNQDHHARNQHRIDHFRHVLDSIRVAPLDQVDPIVAGIRQSYAASAGISARGKGTTTTTTTTTTSSTALPVRQVSSDDEDEVIAGNDDPDETNSSTYSSSSNTGSGSSSDSSGSTAGSSPPADSCGPVSPLNTAKSAIDVFVQRFVDAFSPEVDVKSGRAGALRRAAEIRMFSPIIGDAFDAVSVAFFGRSVRDPRVEANGFQLYPKVLRNLQQALLDPERSKAESTLVTVILLMAFESVERTTDSGVISHVHGAVRLIQHRGPENHMYGVEHLLFTELRPYWVGAALTTRRPSFLAQEDWKTIPWSAGTTEKDILHHLLDLAVDIPALLGQSDELNAASAATLSAHERTVKQTALWDGIADLTSRFLQWKQTYVDGYADGPPCEVPPATPFYPSQTGKDGFPIFHCRNLLTGAAIVPSKFRFPDLRVAQSLCVYFATRLILSSVDSRPPGEAVGPLDQYALACGICRSIEWYILTAPGNMINRLAFPVRVAWEVFPDGGPERRYMYEVLKVVERRHSLALWGSSMPELSPRRGSPPR